MVPLLEMMTCAMSACSSTNLSVIHTSRFTATAGKKARVGPLPVVRNCRPHNTPPPSTACHSTRSGAWSRSATPKKVASWMGQSDFFLQKDSTVSVSKSVLCLRSAITGWPDVKSFELTCTPKNTPHIDHIVVPKKENRLCRKKNWLALKDLCLTYYVFGKKVL